MRRAVPYKPVNIRLTAAFQRTDLRRLPTPVADLIASYAPLHEACDKCRTVGCEQKLSVVFQTGKSDFVAGTITLDHVLRKHCSCCEDWRRLLELCCNEMTVLAFTGSKWCVHCIAVQPTLTQWKKLSLAELGFRFQQFDTDDCDAIVRFRRWGIDRFPSFLIFDPSTRMFKQFSGDVASLPSSDLRQIAGSVWMTVPNEVRLVFSSCMPV